jgi:hypothetical protein
MSGRKKRTDRNHCVYVIECLITGERYIGITAAKDRAFKASILERFGKHVSRSKCEPDKKYALYESMRAYGPENFQINLICVVRGKEAAHKLECEEIHTGKYALNTHGVKRNATNQVFSTCDK